MLCHISGRLAARRVVSRKPLPAHCKFCSPTTRVTTAISVLAAICGRWLTAAIRRSCSSPWSASTIGLAPRASTNFTARCMASGASGLVRNHGASSKSSARAPAGPGAVPPAIGCPPTKLRMPAIAAAIITARLVLPVSMMSALASTAAGSCGNSLRIASTGVARITTRASPIFDNGSPSSTVMICNAGQRRVAAKPIDVPIRPGPTIASPREVSGTLALPRPPAACDRLETDTAPDCRRDDAEFRHQTIELCREHRLGPVAQSAIGIVVHLDDQAVGAGGDGRPRHGRDFIAAAHAVAGIDKDRKMRELLHDRNCRQVQRVAREGFEGANTALAQDHVLIAAGQDVLRRQQPFLHRRSNAALQEDRLTCAAEVAEERKVLHVAR